MEQIGTFLQLTLSGVAQGQEGGGGEEKDGLHVCEKEALETGENGTRTDLPRVFMHESNLPISPPKWGPLSDPRANFRV